MISFDRRRFVGATASGLAALLSAPTVLLGQQQTVIPPTAEKPDTLFLTWHGDPTTTMTIQWVGPEWKPEDSAVFYTASRGWFDIEDGIWQAAPATTTKPFPLTDLTNHRVTLTNLKPGRDYRFRIGSNPTIFKFRTMPAKLTDEITFVSGGDAGVSTHTIENNKLAAKQDPYFVLIGGDLAYDNGINAKTYLQWLRDYSQHMVDHRGRLIPLITCLGNHEVKGSYGKTRAEAPFFFAHFDGLYNDTTYATLDIGDYLSLVLLDSGHCSKIAGDQTDWLDKALQDRVERPHLIAVNHVPCYPSYRPAEGMMGKGGTGEEQRKNWVPLFEKHNVDVVLEHHDHTFKRTHPLKGGLKDKYGIVYLGDGSWGKLRSITKPESRPYLATAKTAYHMTVHRLEADQAFHMALEEGGKIADVCRTEKKVRRRG